MKSENPNEDYKQMMQVIRETENEFNNVSNMLSDFIKTTYGLKPEVFNAVLTIHCPKVAEEYDEEKWKEIGELLFQYAIEPDSFRENWLQNSDDIFTIFTATKQASSIVKSSQLELEAMKRESSTIVSDRIKQLQSAGNTREKREEKLKALKDASLIEVDIYSKKKIDEKIAELESSLNFDFLTKRLANNPKEAETIMNTFFDKRKGSYVIDKYVNRIHLFKYEEGIYKLFFNLEENFLPEEYHPFNNLFLFIYMRFVAYRDPYKSLDYVQVHALTDAISMLVYHIYNKKKDELEGNTEDEEVLKDKQDYEQDTIDLIKKVDDFFMEYLNIFMERNQTRPGHPLRIQAAEKREAERKTMLINQLKSMNIEGYDESWTADELQRFFNDQYENLVKTQQDEMDAINGDIEDAADLIPDDVDVEFIDETDPVNIEDIPAGLKQIQEVTADFSRLSKEYEEFLLSCEDQEKVEIQLIKGEDGKEHKVAKDLSSGNIYDMTEYDDTYDLLRTLQEAVKNDVNFEDTSGLNDENPADDVE